MCIVKMVLKFERTHKYWVRLLYNLFYIAIDSIEDKYKDIAKKHYR